MADEKDWGKLERNMRKLLQGGASQQEMDDYLKLEGVTPDQFKGRPRAETFIPDPPESGPITAPPSMLKAPGAATTPAPDESKGGTETPPAPVPMPRWQGPELPGARFDPEGPPPDYVAPPPPSSSTLATPDTLSQPTHWILPYPGAPRRVPSRLTQEQWDRQVMVRQLARRLQQREGPAGFSDAVSSSMMFGFLPQFRGLGMTGGEILARHLRPDRQDLESDLDLGEIYSLYRDAYRYLMNEYAKENPATNLGASLLGGFLTGGPRPSAGAVVSAEAPSLTRQLVGASGWGAGGGAAQGAAENPETYSSAGAGAVTGALGGTVLGPVAYLGLRGLLRGRDWFRQWRRTGSVDSPAERAHVWQQLGVEPPPTALLTGPSRQVADHLGTTPWGFSLQRTTGEGLARLQQSLTEALRFGGGPRTATQAGEEAQALIRRALGSGRTPDEIARMSVEELRMLSGVEPLTPPPRRETLDTDLPARIETPFQPSPELAQQIARIRAILAEAEAARAQARAALEPHIRRGREPGNERFYVELARREQELADARNAMAAVERMVEDLRVTHSQRQHMARQERQQAELERLRTSASRETASPTHIGLPPTIESFQTQLAAGERALAGIAPGMRGRLLGSRTEPRTALAEELDAIAREAHSALKLSGYRPERLFSHPGEEIFPGLLEYLGQELGARAGRYVDNLLRRLAAQRGGQFAQGMTGTSRILADLQTLRGARGVTPEGQNILDRIIAAIERDVARTASNTPEGMHWLQQRERLNAARTQIERQFTEPLRAVTGTDNPAAALQLLQQSMRPGGDLRVLRAFLSLAQQKGDRASAVSLLLTDLAGDNLQTFLRNWRALTPEARALLFVNETADIGARLDRFATAIGHVGDFPTSWRLRDMPRFRNIFQGLMTYFYLRPGLVSVAGQVLADRVLSSAPFKRWMLRMPLEAGMRSQEWQRHMGFLSGALARTSGLTPDAGRQVEQALRSLLGSAFAETPPDPSPGSGPPGGGEAPPGRGKGSVQTFPEEVTSTTDLPPWHRARVDEDQSVLHHDSVDLTPDQSIMAGKPRPPRRPAPQVGATMPSMADIVTQPLRQVLPRTTVDRLHPAIEYSPFEGAFQGGRMMAYGVENLDLGSTLLGGLSAWPGNMGIVMGMPGARRLAMAGRGNAQTMLHYAETRMQQGVPFRQIQQEVSARLAMLGDTEVGTVVRLPNGRLGIEMVSAPERFYSMAPYEVRSVRDIRPDPSLYTAHPEVGDVRVWYNPSLPEHGVLGYADATGIGLHRPPNALGSHRVLEHELQHWVSARSGFPSGAMIRDYEPGGRYAHLRPPGMTARQAYDATADEWLANQSMQRMYASAESLREAPLEPPPGLIVPRDQGHAGAGMARPRRWDADSMQEIAQLLDQGMTRAQVAQRLGVSRVALDRAILRYGDEAGIDVRTGPDRFIWQDRDRVRQLQELWEANVPTRDIATQMGLTVQQVRSGVSLLRGELGLRTGRGIRPDPPLPRLVQADRPGQARWTPELLAEVQQAAERGYSRRQIADAFGVSEDALNEVLRRRNVPVRANPSTEFGGISPEVVSRIKEMFQQGATRPAIAAEVGLPLSRIASLLTTLRRRGPEAFNTSLYPAGFNLTKELAEGWVRRLRGGETVASLSRFTSLSVRAIKAALDEASARFGTPTLTQVYRGRAG